MAQPAAFPAGTSISCRRSSSRTLPRRRLASAICGASWMRTTTASTPSWASTTAPRVVDVTNPEAPQEIDFIPGVFSSWREIKVYQVFNATTDRHDAYAYISTEGEDGGLQIIDLSDLPASVTLANTLRDFSTSHTLYISNADYATNKALPSQQAFLYVAGADVDEGAFRIYDLSDPVSPQLVTTNPGLGGTTLYMHDSTSVLITDARTTQCANAHNPCEVLVDFNVERVELWDVTDKSQPVHLGGRHIPERAVHPFRLAERGWALHHRSR